MAEQGAASRVDDRVSEPLWTSGFILHFIASFLLAISLYFILTTLPLFVSEDLHGNLKDIGLITTLFTFSAVLARPFLGYLIDSFGRRVVLLVALFFFICINTLHMFVATVGFLLVLRALQGLPWGAAQTATSTLAADLIPESRRGEGLGYFGLTFTFAGALGPFLALWILSVSNFQTLFLVSSVLTTIAFVISFFPKYEDLKDRNASFNIRSVVEYRIIGIAFVTLLMTMSWGGILSFITVFSREQHLPSAGLFFTFDAVGTLLSRVKAGQLFDKHGPLWLVTAGFILLSVSCLLLAVATGPILFCLSALCLGIGFGISIPAFQAMVMNLVEPLRRGAANATLYSAFDIGIGMGAYLLGLLAAATSFRIMWFVEGLLLIVPLLLFVFIIMPRYKLRMLAKDGAIMLDHSDAPHEPFI